MVYGKYVAKEPIDFNGVRAFQPGDPVPEDSVEAHGWGDLVEEAPEPDADEPSGQSTPPAAPGSPAGKTAGPATKKPGGPRGTSSGD